MGGPSADLLTQEVDELKAFVKLLRNGSSSSRS